MPRPPLFLACVSFGSGNEWRWQGWKGRLHCMLRVCIVSLGVVGLVREAQIDTLAPTASA